MPVSSICFSIGSLNWSANQAVDIEFAATGKTFHGPAFLVDKE